MCDPCPGYGQCVIVDGKKCCGYVYNDEAFCKNESPTKVLSRKLQLIRKVGKVARGA